MTDKESKILFLIDNGAQASLQPATSEVKHSIPSKLTLRAINGTLIHTYGEKCMELDLGLRSTYTHIFTVADVGCAILGTDFFTKFLTCRFISLVFERPENVPESEWSG